MSALGAPPGATPEAPETVTPSDYMETAYTLQRDTMRHALLVICASGVVRTIELAVLSPQLTGLVLNAVTIAVSLLLHELVRGNCLLPKAALWLTLTIIVFCASTSHLILQLDPTAVASSREQYELAILCELLPRAPSTRAPMRAPLT